MLGYAGRDLLKLLWPMYEVTAFPLAMLAGEGLQLALNCIGYGRHVDRQVMTRIGSTASDYLVAFGIAAIQPTVVRTYAVPLA